MRIDNDDDDDDDDADAGGDAGYLCPMYILVYRASRASLEKKHVRPPDISRSRSSTDHLDPNHAPVER